MVSKAPHPLRPILERLRGIEGPTAHERLVLTALILHTQWDTLENAHPEVDTLAQYLAGPGPERHPARRQVQRALHNLGPGFAMDARQRCPRSDAGHQHYGLVFMTKPATRYTAATYRVVLPALERQPALPEVSEAPVLPVVSTGGADGLWKALQESLRPQVSRANFDTWVESAAGIAVDEGVLTVLCASQFAREWMEKRLQAQVQAALPEGIERVRYVDQEALRAS